MRITEDQVDHPAVHQWKQEYDGDQNVILQAGYNTSTPNEIFQENPYLIKNSQAVKKECGP